MGLTARAVCTHPRPCHRPPEPNYAQMYVHALHVGETIQRIEIQRGKMYSHSKMGETNYHRSRRRRFSEAKAVNHSNASLSVTSLSL